MDIFLNWTWRRVGREPGSPVCLNLIYNERSVSFRRTPVCHTYIRCVELAEKTNHAEKVFFLSYTSFLFCQNKTPLHRHSSKNHSNKPRTTGCSSVLFIVGVHSILSVFFYHMYFVPHQTRHIQTVSIDSHKSNKTVSARTYNGVSTVYIII